MRDAIFGARWKQLLLVALCVSGAAWSQASYARDDHGDGAKRRYSHADQRPSRDHGYRRDGRREHWYDGRRYHGRGRDWHSRRDHRHPYRHRDWHYHNGRYWAPPRYRGRYCDDRRHHHGVHYHVAARDYYDYYYPRYRYYGPRPFGANASVIISIPLF